MPAAPKRFYVTTSIPYVNADPHLGFALEVVQADVLARHRRLRGDQVRLLSGTDDHAIKNVQAADRAGLPVAEFVAQRAGAFRRLGEQLNASYDDFLRTSVDPRHRAGAERLWRACAAAGDIDRRHYEGLYCVGCEQFYTHDELVDGVCPAHGTAPTLVSEENWFFRLSRYQKPLRELLASGRLRIEPEVRANEVRAFVERGLADFSISRSVERARGWGIPVPNDPTQVMYVWWDALGYYVTSLDYGKGPDAEAFRTWWAGDGRRVHVIGKDILRFHAVYWPAMLLSAGLPLPTDIYVHDFLTANGQKLSKTLGNVVDPVHLADQYGVDAVRWWLIAEVSKVGDTDFTLRRLVDAANRDLAGGLGNVAQRVLAMVHRFRGGVVPPAVSLAVGVAPSRVAVTPGPGVLSDRIGAALARLDAAASGLPHRIDAALEDFDLRRAARAITAFVAEINRCIERTAPWALAKAERGGDADAGLRLDQTLATLVAALRVLAREIEPFVPGLAAKLAHQSGSHQPDGALPRLEPLFRRVEIAECGGDGTGASEIFSKVRARA